MQVNHRWIPGAMLAAAVIACGQGRALAQSRPAKPAATAAASAAPPSLADSLTGMAKAEFEAAKILYGVGDYANAIIKFRKAHELAGDPRLLWNIAACEKSLLHYTRALAAIERYLKDGGDTITEANRTTAGEFIKAVKPLISTLKVLVSEPGADIFLDDEKVGTSPLSGTILADVGKRTIRVEKSGFQKFAETREVQGATEISLAVKLEKEVHRGKVILEAGPGDILSIDGKVVAQGRWEGVLPSGGHALRVTAPGMLAHQSEIVVQDNKTRRIQIALNPAPRPGDTATWVWLAGGAAILAGAAVGGALLFKPTYVPEAEGTLGKSVPLSFRGW